MSGSGELDEEVMHKLLQSMESSCVDRRTRATFTLLKLCNSKSSNSLFDVVDRGHG